MHLQPEREDPAPILCEALQKSAPEPDAFEQPLHNAVHFGISKGWRNFSLGLDRLTRHAAHMRNESSTPP